MNLLSIISFSFKSILSAEMMVSAKTISGYGSAHILVVEAKSKLPLNIDIHKAISK